KGRAAHLACSAYERPPDAKVTRAMAADAYARLERACAELDAPFALVDVDALWANAADMERRAAPKPIRLASKSVRCRALQERILARPGFRGTLAYTLPEALWLASHGAGDLLVAYPTADRDALQALGTAGAVDGEARSPQAACVSVMVDSVEQLEMIDEARAAGARAPVRVCIDA